MKRTSFTNQRYPMKILATVPDDIEVSILPPNEGRSGHIIFLTDSKDRELRIDILHRLIKIGEKDVISLEDDVFKTAVRFLFHSRVGSPFEITKIERKGSTFRLKLVMDDGKSLILQGEVGMRAVYSDKSLDLSKVEIFLEAR